MRPHKEKVGDRPSLTRQNGPNPNVLFCLILKMGECSKCGFWVRISISNIMPSDSTWNHSETSDQTELLQIHTCCFFYHWHHLLLVHFAPGKKRTWFLGIWLLPWTHSSCHLPLKKFKLPTCPTFVRKGLTNFICGLIELLRSAVKFQEVFRWTFFGYLFR